MSTADRCRDPKPVLLPEWIADSVKAGRRLPIEDYSLARIRDKPGQKALTGFTPQKASRSAAEVTAASDLGLPRIAELHESQLVGQEGAPRKPTINLSLQTMEQQAVSGQHHAGQHDAIAQRPHGSLQGLVGLAKKLQQVQSSRPDGGAKQIRQAGLPGDGTGARQGESPVLHKSPESPEAAEQDSEHGHFGDEADMCHDEVDLASPQIHKGAAYALPPVIVASGQSPEHKGHQLSALNEDEQEAASTPEPAAQSEGPGKQLIPMPSGPSNAGLPLELPARESSGPHPEPQYGPRSGPQQAAPAALEMHRPGSAGAASSLETARPPPGALPTHQHSRQLDVNTPMEVLAQDTSQQAAELYAMKARQRCDLLRGPPRSSRDDPAFQSTYFSASRLHFIGSWKARNEALLLGMVSEGPQPAPPAKGTPRTIVHIDMDCFFASVAGEGPCNICRMLCMLKLVLMPPREHCKGHLPGSNNAGTCTDMSSLAYGHGGRTIWLTGPSLPQLWECQRFRARRCASATPPAQGVRGRCPPPTTRRAPSGCAPACSSGMRTGGAPTSSSCRTTLRSMRTYPTR